jgi:hypothetical protein
MHLGERNDTAGSIIAHYDAWRSWRPPAISYGGGGRWGEAERGYPKIHGDGLLLFGLPILGIQVVGSFEGIMEVKIGTFTTFMDRKPVLLIVPNQVAAGVSLPSHYVPKRHGGNSHHVLVRCWLSVALCAGPTPNRSSIQNRALLALMRQLQEQRAVVRARLSSSQG